MKRNGNLWDSRIFSIIVILVISVSVLAAYSIFNREVDHTSDLTTPIDMETVDSSNCIVCHTDGNVLTELAVVEDASDHAAEGG